MNKDAKMHPNLALFKRDATPNDSHASPSQRRLSITSANHDSPIDFRFNPPRRWDHDILGDQHRMLGPEKGWRREEEETASPPPLPIISSSSSTSFLAEFLREPMIVHQDEDEVANGIDLWLAPIPDFQAHHHNDEEPSWISPSPDTSAGTGLSSPFASTATTTTTTTATVMTTITRPSSLVSTAAIESSTNHRPCDRRTLELIHFFFNNLTPDLLSPSATACPVAHSETDADPWRRLILPLTYGGEPLRAAVCAIASAHLEGIGALTTRDSASYREVAGEALAAQMDGEMDRDGLVPATAMALATMLLLVHYDSMTCKDMTIILSHLSAAHELLSRPRDRDHHIILFLEKIFHLYDVSAALSQGSEPVASAHTWNTMADCTGGSSPSRPSSSSSPKFLLTNIDPNTLTTSVDAVFGLTFGLWPILHRLASLRVLTHELHEASSSSASASQPLKMAVLRGEHQSATIAIGNALERWYPLRRHIDNTPLPSPLASTCASASALPSASASASASASTSTSASASASVLTTPPGSPTVTTNSSSSSFTNNGRSLTPQTAIAYHHALCYRESALVYLHRAVRLVPASHPLVRDAALATLEHAHAALQQGSVRLPLWPLLIAACSLEGGPDRMLATRTFQFMGMTAQSSAAKRLWSIVAGVWRKLDVAATMSMYDDDDLDQGHGETLDAFEVLKDAVSSMGLSVFL